MRPSNALFQFTCGTLLCIVSALFKSVELAIYGLIVFAGLVSSKS